MKSEINVQQIMTEIKQEIKEKGLTPDILDFNDIPYSDPTEVENGTDFKTVNKSLKFANLNYVIQPYKVLKGNPAVVFIKKVIRKSIKFYIEPTVSDQNNFNANVVRVLNYLMQTLNPSNGTIEKRLESIESQNKELSLELKKLIVENKKLNEEIKRLEKK